MHCRETRSVEQRSLFVAGPKPSRSSLSLVTSPAPRSRLNSVCSGQPISALRGTPLVPLYCCGYVPDSSGVPAVAKAPDTTEGADSIATKVFVAKTVHFVDVFSFVSHYTKDRDARLVVCKCPECTIGKGLILFKYCLATMTELKKEELLWECYE
jgi:hypothetical protein